MNMNLKLIWMNRTLNVVAIVSGVVSGLIGAVAAIGDVVKTIQGLGLVPNKYLGLAGAISLIGIAAAKISKTPSQAMAAAIPPSKLPPTDTEKTNPGA